MPTKLITRLKRHATELLNQLKKDETLQHRMTMLKVLLVAKRPLKKVVLSLMSRPNDGWRDG